MIDFFSLKHIERRNNNNKSNIKSVKSLFNVFNFYNKLKILKFNVDFIFFIEIVKYLFEILYHIVREYIMLRVFEICFTFDHIINRIFTIISNIKNLRHFYLKKFKALYQLEFKIHFSRISWFFIIVIIVKIIHVRVFVIKFIIQNKGHFNNKSELSTIITFV